MDIRKQARHQLSAPATEDLSAAAAHFGLRARYKLTRLGADHLGRCHDRELRISDWPASLYGLLSRAQMAGRSLFLEGRRSEMKKSANKRAPSKGGIPSL